MSGEGITFETAPDSIACAECGEEIETGYLPAVGADGAFRPRPDLAVCDACGFTAVGFAGCAPGLGDLDETGEADVLVRIEVDDAGVNPTSVTDRA